MRFPFKFISKITCLFTFILSCLQVSSNKKTAIGSEIYSLDGKTDPCSIMRYLPVRFRVITHILKSENINRLKAILNIFIVLGK